MMDARKTPNKLIVGVVVVILLVAAAAAVIAINDNGQTSSTSDSGTAQTSTTETSGAGTNNATNTSGNYKDGTYSATGNYRTPGGQESIEVKLTLADGVITDASVTQNASGGEAEEYQSMFVSGYKSEVVGKKIDEVNVSRVAGSSLTPSGFNAALDEIKSDAKA